MHILNFGYIFEWDELREKINVTKHGFDFETAREVFEDSNAIYLEDDKHSKKENRYFAVGKTYGGDVLIVRYTKRGNLIRIFGAASWRKWRKFYEKRKNTRSL